MIWAGALLFGWFPILVVAALLCPVFCIARFRLLAREGEGEHDERFRRRWWWFGWRTALLGYTLFVIAFALPDVLPRVREFLESGRLGAVVLLILIDLVLINVFSPDRALRRHARMLEAGKEMR